MKKLFTKTAMILLATGLFLTSCKKEKKPVTVPELSTSATSSPLATSAMGGGNITSDGGAAVTASGLCYSKTSQVPTVSNDTTLTKVTSGSFTSMLKNLTPSSTYYVRAYATNSIGTGYGEVVTFSTGNGGPVATNVAIVGKVEVGETLTANYTYSDAENDAEDVPVYQWYRANDVNGTGEATIAGATSKYYTLLAADEFKFIKVGVTAKAKAGTAIGPQVKSVISAAVATEPTTVTFTYNGKQVTYGIIKSSVTGRKWLDRNLGAPNTPSAYNDWANYGDLFQWGRGADGHQLVTRGSSNGETKSVNPTTTTLSAGDSPGHSSFILTSNTPFNWRNTRNDNLWQVTTNVNNPCPSGWHIPNEEEWDLEKLSLVQDAYSQLKITLGGARFNDTGAFSGTTSRGEYWSSTFTSDEAVNIISYSYRTSGPATKGPNIRSAGMHCKCIKNQ